MTHCNQLYSGFGYEQIVKMVWTSPREWAVIWRPWQVQLRFLTQVLVAEREQPRVHQNVWRKVPPIHPKKSDFGWGESVWPWRMRKGNSFEDPQCQNPSCLISKNKHILLFGYNFQIKALLNITRGQRKIKKVNSRKNSTIFLWNANLKKKRKSKAWKWMVLEKTDNVKFCTIEKFFLTNLDKLSWQFFWWKYLWEKGLNEAHLACWSWKRNVGNPERISPLNNIIMQPTCPCKKTLRSFFE